MLGQIDFLVCVRCFTYNQADYIEDAMNGFTTQQTCFPFVCVIVDDASTDGEQEVIRKYMEDYFEMGDKTVARNKETDDYTMTFAQHRENKNCFFAVYYLKYNHWGKKDKMPYISEFTNNAEYHAMCEGDDYWIDSLKLQKQVDIMEKDANIGLVYTMAKIIENGKQTSSKVVGKKIERIDELLINNDIPTLSVCYRRELYEDYVKNLSSNFDGLSMGDYPIWLYIFSRRSISFINNITCVYRKLVESASHSMSLDKMNKFRNDELFIKLYYLKYAEKRLANKTKTEKGIINNYLWSNYRDKNKLKNDYYLSFDDFRRLLMVNKFKYVTLCLLSLIDIRL